jgi:histidinol-phosphate aminotransferase
MNNLLKLDFNERCDSSNPVTREYPNGDSLWLYPAREPLEKQIAGLNDLSPSQVLCTNGGDEAIMILMRIIKESSQLILPLPAFSQYTWGIESWSLNAMQIPALADDLSIDIKETEAAISGTENSIVILTRPNNPSGELISIADLINMIEIAQTNNSWVFLDEAYIEFSQEKPVAKALLNRFDNLVILRTLSKAYGLAGIRLGYLLGSEKLINEFKNRCMPFNIPQLSLDIASKALSTENQRDVDNYCQTIISNRENLASWFAEIGISIMPSQANFIMLNLPQGQAKAISSFLLKNDIAVRSFVNQELSRCIRITIPYEMARLNQLLKQCLQPELVCLDMDGVLIDTSDSYDQCVIATINILSDKVISLKDINSLRRLGGFNNEWVLTQKLLSNLGFDFDIKEVTEVFQQLYLADDSQSSHNRGLCSNETSLINEQLKAIIINSKSCVFSIVTGRPKQEAKIGQTLINLQQLDLISLDDVSIGKPSPEGINRLQDKYSNLSWMCGDNVDDMQAAVTSNSLAIGIGVNNADALYNAGADIVLENINQLEQWLCQIKL